MTAKLTKTQQAVLDKLIAKRDSARNAGSYRNFYKGALGTNSFEEFVAKQVENDRKWFGKESTCEEMANCFIKKYEDLCNGIGVYIRCVDTRTLKALEKKGYIELKFTNGDLDRVNLR